MKEEVIVNRIQKSHKKAGLEPTDAVEVYFEPLDDNELVFECIMKSHEQYIREAVGSPLLGRTMMPSYAVIILEEKFHGVSGLSFVISLARPCLIFNSDVILKWCSGNKKHAEGLQTYLSSRDHSNLKSEFHVGKAKINVGCIEDQPTVDVILGDHLFLTVGDYYLSRS